jgi:hypothetical protein
MQQQRRHRIPVVTSHGSERIRSRRGIRMTMGLHRIQPRRRRTHRQEEQQQRQQHSRLSRVVCSAPVRTCMVHNRHNWCQPAPTLDQ